MRQLSLSPLRNRFTLRILIGWRGKLRRLAERNWRFSPSFVDRLVKTPIARPDKNRFVAGQAPVEEARWRPGNAGAQSYRETPT
jgi:hypothetical protein